MIKITMEKCGECADYPTCKLDVIEDEAPPKECPHSAVSVSEEYVLRITFKGKREDLIRLREQLYGLFPKGNRGVDLLGGFIGEDDGKNTPHH